ncbi:hypothetical protein [Nocardioides sp.]|uniref:hypothetical protein n=1 Tax=Nocardioides sp. TaxID=35761 RepID=UPI0035684183
MAKSHPRRNDTPAAPFIGMAGMSCAFFLYAASGLLTPWWAAVGLMLVWAVLLFLATAWWTPRPHWLPYLAVFTVVFWFATVNAGAYWLGWGT